MDPKSKEFLDQFNGMKIPPMELMPLNQLRTMVDSFSTLSTVDPGTIQDLKIQGPHGEIPIRLYIPKGQGPFPVFVYFHGGGWVFGSLLVGDSLCRDISKEANALVVSVDYRLAPEHKFPTALEECYATVIWAQNHIEEYHGDSQKISIGGDSSGGNLAAAVTLMAKEKGNPSIHSQVLIYPITQPQLDTESYQKYAKGHFLTKDQMQWFWNAYIHHQEEANNPLVSPLLAKEVKGLPPALIIVAEYDPLHEDGKLYAEKLKKAGVPVVFKSYPTIHVFVTKSEELPIAKKAIQEIVNYLKK